MARDYYGILGVRRDATNEEIKRAYRKLARELHPDVNPDPEAQQRFREVTVAYEVLSDPQKRKIVDLGGDPLATAGAGSGMGDPFAGFGLSDIMDAFFGTSQAARGPRSRVQPGADALIRLDLTLEECAAGTQRELTVDTAVLCDRCAGSGCPPGVSPQVCDMCGGRGNTQTGERAWWGRVVPPGRSPTGGGRGGVIPEPCQQCAGEGRMRARRMVSVKIPPGVADGMRIRLAGQGEVGPGGGPAGDLYVEVEELVHETFTRDGADLHCVVKVPMTMAALGAVLPLTTLEGTEELRLEAGTQSGSVLRLPGGGVPRLRSSGRTEGRGDLYVHVEVLTPTRVDARQAELLRQLADLRGEERLELATNGRSGLFSRLRDTLGGR